MMIQKKTVFLINSLFHFKKHLLCCILLIHSISLSVFAAQQNELKGVRSWPSPDNTRVVLDLSNKPDYETHYLTKPDRLVIDLSNTTNKTNLKAIVKKGKVVKNIRESGSNKATTFRLVIDLKQASKAKIFSLPPAKPYGHRLVIDLPVPSSKIVKSAAPVSVPNGRDIIIAVDAGHGGDDPGALGKYTYEKKVTLQIAKRLKNKIDAQKGMHAFLIRTGDYFVNLNKRSEIARKGQADFLVSIHADGFTSSRPKGASVWVLSNRRATTELGRWMEKNEAQSELLGGAGDLIQGSESVPFLNKMLLDMSMGNTMGVGYNIGSLVTDELAKVTTMHKKQPVHASLAVLKSPDIPSILVEAGFITNHTEERLLNQAEFQNKISNAVFKGIYNHFSQKPPQGSLFAQNKRATKHTVRSGESLSILAKRYSVSSKELKEFNHLKSNSLKIGQVLSIPENYQVVIENESATASTIAPQQVQKYKVVSGDSLSVIADRYNKSMAEIVAFNNLSSRQLKVGQVLSIPGVAAKANLAPAQKAVVQKTVVQKELLHKVQKGEYLSGIAVKYDKSIQQILSYNKLTSTSIYVGQKLKIPNVNVVVNVPAPTPKVIEQKEQIHRVKAGESLSVIASKYNSSTSTLKNYNNLKTTSINVGQRIKIPGSRSSSTRANPVSKPVKAPQPTKHKVVSGESLSVIARKYNRSSKQFQAYNKLSSSKLLVGQVLKIPSENYVVPTTPSLHIVTRGQSLSVIAAKYGLTTQDLKSFNRLRSSSLKVGQKLKIPSNKKTKHKVRSGESLSVIAKRYGTTTRAIISANNLRSQSLAIGQVLTIPVS